MTSYSGSSSEEPRSPLYGTATFSTLSPTQTPYSSSRLSYSERSVTPIGSHLGSEISSPRQMRRIPVSPSLSRRTYSDDYSDENSMDDIREVEATLSMVDDEIANTEDALTEWSRGGSSVGPSDYSSQTGFTGQYSAATSVTPSSYLSEGYRTMTDALLDRERRVLSTISEHTEERSRPTSFAQSGSGGSRPTSMHANIPATEHRWSVNLDGGRASPAAFHSRSATDPSGANSPAPQATGRVVNVPGRRAGELIAFFEEKRVETESPRLLGHARTLSAPMGPRSPAPRSPGPRSPSPYATTMSQSLSTFPYTAGSTSYAYGSSTYAYSSRPSSPTKSRGGSSVSSSGPITTMSSMVSPTYRGTPLTSESRFTPTSSNTFTQTRSGTEAHTRTISGGSSASGSVTGTGSYSNTFTGFASTATPTSSLRRPQTSPRSPLTSVRNIVAAWKERTPSLSKSGRSGSATPSPTQGEEGLFSLRRRAERGAARLRDHALGEVDEHGMPIDGGESAVDMGASTSGDPTLSTSGMLPATFDIEELGQYANVGGTQEPLRIGLLWYLNVHAPPPYRWQRCQALLYPHMLLLSWIAPGGGRGIVTLDLLNCIEVRSVPSPLHPTAQDDIGTMAARMQSEQAASSGSTGHPSGADMGLMETLCPFQLLYADGIERLGAESARERVRWVSAIWEVLDRAVSIPDRSSTRSPTGSIRTIRSMTSTTSSHSSGTGSASTVYVPPLDELSDIQSLSGSSSLSRRPSLVSAHHARATDDAAVSSQGYLYPGDPRVIAPSRSSSLRRTSSMTDLDEEFASALQRARESRPGLGFGLGLASGISSSDASPVTVSSGPRLGGRVYMSPPPSARGGSDRKSRSSGSEVSSALSDDHFFAARSQTPSTSSFYSSSSFTHGLTDTTDTRTTTGTGTMTGTGTATLTAGSTSGLVTDESIEIASGSGTAVVTSTLSYRGTDSASLLGDSHTGSSNLTPTSPSRTSLTRSGGVRRRTPRGIRSHTISYGSSSESTDRENTYSGAYTMSTLESYSRTGTTPTASMSMSRSRSVTPTPSSLSYTRSTVEEPYHRRSLTEPETDYYTAPPKSPSTASFKSLSTIPSEYETALLSDTEYETARKCESDVETEFQTVPVCTTPAPTEYITAEVCASDVSTEFKTADCKCKDKTPVIRLKDSDEVSLQTPSEIPTIPSSAPSPVLVPVYSPEFSPEMELLPSPSPMPRELELEPADVPLPPSTYVPSEPSERAPTERAPSPTTLTPTSPTEPSLELTPSSPSLTESEVPTPSSFEISTESIEESSIPGPSPIRPLSDLEPTITLSSITSPTESSVTPTPSSQLTPSIPSTISQPLTPTPSSPAVPESAWGVETDESYESSMLRASPSMASQAIPELPDNSFETSGLRPSSAPQTSESSILPTPTISDVSPSSPSIEPSTPSSVSISVPMTQVTAVSPLSPPTVPSTPSSELTPTQSTLSLLPSQYSPLRVPRQFVPPEVTLTRSASMLSTVSSVSMSSSRMAPSEFDLDVRTEPSLLGTPYTEVQRLPSRLPSRPPSAAPLFIPLPPSPIPPTPSPSMRVSISTPRGDVPSIASTLTTVASEAPSHILTHDVNRLLQYLNDVNEARGAENKEMADNIQDIKATLEELEALLRERTFQEPVQVPEPQRLERLEPPPPLPHKDVSVGRSVVSVASAETRRSVRSERPTPAPALGKPELPRLTRAISLSPPPSRRIPSPDTLTETMSFLSSHHSDDLSLMESETYPLELPPSPSWPSSSPVSSPYSSTSSSPTSAPPSSVTPSIKLSDIGLRHLDVPGRPRAATASLSPSATPPPLSSSPSPSTISSDTARPVPPVSLAGVRDDLAGIRQQIANLLDAQDAANRGLDELRDRPMPMPVPMPVPMPASVDRWDEFSERLRVIEESLLSLLERGRAGRPRPEDEQSSVSGLQSLIDNIMRADRDADRVDTAPTIHAPIPRQPGVSFDEQLMEIMMSGTGQSAQPVQAPPPLIPLIYRPGPRARPRSSSPMFEADLPPRPGTFPVTRLPPPSESSRPPRRPLRAMRPSGRQGPPMGVPRSETESLPEVPIVMTDPAIPALSGTRLPDAGPDFDLEVRRRRRHGVDDAGFRDLTVPSRPISAPTMMDEGETGPSWYQPAATEGAQPSQAPVPPPGQTFPPQPPQFVPVAPGPTVVQLPSTFNDILDLLRDNRQGQLAGIEQQSEIITYLRGLNQWLERDVHDRHAEIQSVSARLEQTRDEVVPLLNQIAQAMAMRREGTPAGVVPPPGVAMSGVPTPGMPPPGTIVIPPHVVPPLPGGPFPPGFIPQPERLRPLFPQEQTPSPDHPVIPERMPGPVYDTPVIPQGSYPYAPGPAPPFPTPHVQHPPASYDGSMSDVVPTPLSPSEEGSHASVTDVMVIPPPQGAVDYPHAAQPPPPITVIPPPGVQHEPTHIVLPTEGRSSPSSSSSSYDHRRPSDEYHPQPTPSPGDHAVPPEHVPADVSRIGSQRSSPPPVHIPAPTHTADPEHHTMVAQPTHTAEPDHHTTVVIQQPSQLPQPQPSVSPRPTSPGVSAPEITSPHPPIIIQPPAPMPAGMLPGMVPGPGMYPPPQMPVPSMFPPGVPMSGPETIPQVIHHYHTSAPSSRSSSPTRVDQPLPVPPSVTVVGPSAPYTPSRLPSGRSHRTRTSSHRTRTSSRSPSPTHVIHVETSPPTATQPPILIAPPQQVMQPGMIPTVLPSVPQSDVGRRTFSRPPSPIVIHPSYSHSPSHTPAPIPPTIVPVIRDSSRSPPRTHSPRDHHRPRSPYDPRDPRHDPRYPPRHWDDYRRPYDPYDEEWRRRPRSPSYGRSGRYDDRGYPRPRYSPERDSYGRRYRPPRSRSPDSRERDRPRSRDSREGDRPHHLYSRPRSPERYEGDRRSPRYRPSRPRSTDYEERDRHGRPQRPRSTEYEEGDRHGRPQRPRSTEYEEGDRHGRPLHPRSPEHEEGDRHRPRRPPRSRDSRDSRASPEGYRSHPTHPYDDRHGRPSTSRPGHPHTEPMVVTTGRPPTAFDFPGEHEHGPVHISPSSAQEYEHTITPPRQHPHTLVSHPSVHHAPHTAPTHAVTEGDEGQGEDTLPVPYHLPPHAPSAAESFHKSLMSGPEHAIPVLPPHAGSAIAGPAPTEHIGSRSPRPSEYVPPRSPHLAERVPPRSSHPAEHIRPRSPRTLSVLEFPEDDERTLEEEPHSPPRVVPEPAPHVVPATTHRPEGVPPPITPSAVPLALPVPAVSPPHAIVMAPSGPSDVGLADAEQERQNRFDELAGALDRTIVDLQDGEEKREHNYRANEEERERIFIENERRRDIEAEQRREAVWKELEDRLAALPPAIPAGPAGSPTPPGGGSFEDDVPTPEPSPGPPSTLAPAPPQADDAASIVESMREAASRHAEDIREVIRLEREAAQAERERAQELDQAERDRMHEEYQAHIRALENELGAVRKELEDEKMARATEEAERHERERAEMLEQNDMMRNQLGDLTNLVTEQRDEIARKREVADERWGVKQARWEEKDAQDAATRNMLEQILANQADMMNANVASKDELMAEMRENQRQALDAIEQQRIAYEGTIREMAEAWRADCEQRKLETIEAVKATANEQIPYNVQGYLDEFSRSLATEVRMLLSEVGKLREDKRNLEFQIGELLTFKAKYGPEGQFDPSWKPNMTCVPTEAAPPAEPALEPPPEVPQHAQSAWRSIPTRGSRRSRRTQAAPPPPPPEPVPPPATQSWATWQPNPAFQPSPPIQPVEHLLGPPQGSPGLFGPRSPRDSIVR